jgi:hypothetical protein
MFERARRFEIRRDPRNEAMYNLMVAAELGLHESHICSPDLVARVRRLKQSHACRKARREKVPQQPLSDSFRQVLTNVFGSPPGARKWIAKEKA